MYPPISPQQNHGSTLFSMIKSVLSAGEDSFPADSSKTRLERFQVRVV